MNLKLKAEQTHNTKMKREKGSFIPNGKKITKGLSDENLMFFIPCRISYLYSQG